jgi:hypothetical protein
MNQHGALSTRLSTPAHPAVAVKQHPLKQPFRPDVAAFPKQLWAGTRPCPSSNLASSMNRRFQFQKRSQLSSARTVKRFVVVALDGFLEESAFGAGCQRWRTDARAFSYHPAILRGEQFWSGRTIFVNARLIVLCFRLTLTAVSGESTGGISSTAIVLF